MFYKKINLSKSGTLFEELLPYIISAPKISNTRVFLTPQVNVSLKSLMAMKNDIIILLGGLLWHNICNNFHENQSTGWDFKSGETPTNKTHAHTVFIRLFSSVRKENRLKIQGNFLKLGSPNKPNYSIGHKRRYTIPGFPLTHEDKTHIMQYWQKIRFISCNTGTACLFWVVVSYFVFCILKGYSYLKVTDSYRGTVQIILVCSAFLHWMLLPL